MKAIIRRFGKYALPAAVIAALAAAVLCALLFASCNRRAEKNYGAAVFVNAASYKSMNNDRASDAGRRLK